MAAYKDIGPRKWWATGAICLAAIAFSLDLTVLNLALPVLSSALHASTTQLQWIVDSYSLVLAVLTLPAGLFGDRYGRKRWMLIALVLFGLSSVLCAYSHSVAMLIVARLLLGLGAAFILPLAMSVIPVFFTTEEKPKAIAVLMGGVFLAYPLGPILGGWLLTHYWWGSVFLINVPIVLLAFIVISILLPESKSSERHRIDWMGILLSSVGLTGITYGAIEAGMKGWGSASALAPIAAGLAVLIGFYNWERSLIRKHRQPLVDLDLFHSKRFTWGTLLATSVNFSMFGLLFGIPQYFQSVEGRNALGAGYRLLAMIVGLIVGSIVSSRIVSKLGAKATIALGFVIMAGALLAGAHTAIGSSDAFVLGWNGVVGIGLGFAMPSAIDAALGALSPERSGAGSALVTAIRQVGGTIGVGVLGSLLSANYRSDLHVSHLPTQAAAAARTGVEGGVAVAREIHSSALLLDVRTAFVHGMDVMLGVSCGIALVAVVLCVLFLPNKEKSPEQ